MQQSTLTLGFSILFCLAALSAFSQQPTNNQSTNIQPEDTVVSRPRPKKPDSLKEKFYFRSIRVGTDLISLIKTPVTRNTPSNSFAGWEINGDADFGKLYFTVDVGQWARTYDIHYADYGHYENSGTYFRIGADLNLLTKDPERNMFFFGIRFGHSFYSESATLIFPSGGFFPGSAENVHNNGVTASWAELTTGLRVKVWKGFWMGYTGRMKFAGSAMGDTEFKSFDIPGYGSDAEGITWGFNYQVFWKFGVVKKKPIVK